MADEMFSLFKTRSEWRAWLEKNHANKRIAWVILFKKHSGRTGLSYGEAVEEALCFGWIDSLPRTIDEDRFALKFTPRKTDSVWSKSNIERVEKMIREGKMAPAGAALIAEAKKRGRWDTACRLRERQNTPQDLEEALSRNREALENFNNFAPGYKNQYIFWVNDAKQVETRKRRIIEVVKRAAENKKPGSK